MTIQHKRTAQSFIQVLLLAARSQQELSEQDANDLLVVAKTVDQFLGLVETSSENGEECALITDDVIGDFSTVEDYVEALLRLRSVEA